MGHLFTKKKNKKYTFVFVFDAADFGNDLLICMFPLLFYLILFAFNKLLK